VITETSPRGNATGADPAQYTTSYTLDGLGRRDAVTDPLGHVTQTTYNGIGNVIAQTDALGHRTTTIYDADDEPIEVTRPDGSTETTRYDAAGSVTSQTNAQNETTIYTRNVAEQVLGKTDPLGRTTSYAYDSDGNQISKTDPEGRVTSYGYDPANRLVSVSYSDATTPNVGYLYNEDGQRTWMTDGAGATTYSYDSLSRLTRVIDGNGNAAGYAYDLANDETAITYPNGKSVTQSFDAAGRVTSATDWLGNTTTFAYDADSDPTTITFPTGTAETDTTTYNEDRQSTGVTMTGTSGTLASLAYARDDDGRVTSETPSGLPGGEQTLAYNQLGDLTQSGAGSYSYNAADSPTTEASAAGYAYDPSGELTNSTTATYTYDDLGQRTVLTPTTGAATSYTYDQAGNLSSISRATATSMETYSGDGLLASQTAGGTTASYTWDTTQSVPLLLSDTTNSYIYAPNGLPIEQVSVTGTPTYLHHDQLGSTRLLTSTTGSVLATFSYDAYGNRTGATGTATTPLGYAGEYRDDNTGLVYLRARWYDPATAQFLTVDPLAAITGEPYNYANNNPLNQTDPTGLDANPLLGGLDTDLGNIENSIGNAIVNHIGQVAEVGAIAVCADATFGVCLAVTAAGLSTSEIQNASSSHPSTAGALVDLLGAIPGLKLTGIGLAGGFGKDPELADEAAKPLQQLANAVGLGALGFGPVVEGAGDQSCG
jgi:RHS repeat-associated protein